MTMVRCTFGANCRKFTSQKWLLPINGWGSSTSLISSLVANIERQNPKESTD